MLALSSCNLLYIEARHGQWQWTPYARQELGLQIFHLRDLRLILCIKWDESWDTFYSTAGLSSILPLLRQPQLRWLGHVHRVEDGLIPVGLLYVELKRRDIARGCHLLRYRDVCRRDIKALNIELTSWETLLQLTGKLRTKHWSISLSKGKVDRRPIVAQSGLVC